MAMEQTHEVVRSPLRRWAQRMIRPLPAPATVAAPRQSGAGLQLIWHDRWVPDPLRWRLDEIERIREWTPQTRVGAAAWACLAHLPHELAAELIDRLSSVVVIESALELTKRDGRSGRIIPFGVVGCRVVTTAGVNYIAADFNDGGSDISAFDYHGLGTGTGAEAVGDTALGTELTTEYTGNVRATGTPSNPSANVYRSVGTNTLDSGTPAVTEHGLFSASSAGTLLDRTKFTAINLDGTAGDSLQSTYSLTLTAGS